MLWPLYLNCSRRENLHPDYHYFKLSKVMCLSCLSSGEDFWSEQPQLFATEKIPSQLASLLRGQTLTRMIGKMYQSRSAKLSWPANQPGLYLFGDTRPKKSCWTQPYFCRRLVDPGGLKCVSLTTNLYKWLHTGEWVWEGSQSTYMGWFFVLKPPKLFCRSTSHFALLTALFTLHTSHCTLRTPDFTSPGALRLHAWHFTLQTSNFTVHTSHFTLQTALFTPHTSHCTPHTSHSTLHLIWALLTLTQLISSHLISSHMSRKLPWITSQYYD